MSFYFKQIEMGPMANFVYFVGDAEQKKCWVVDPAWEGVEIFSVMKKEGFSFEGILLTHAHFDHANAVDELLKKKEVPVYVNKQEMSFLENHPPVNLFCQLPREHVKLVHANETLKLGGFELTFLHTPGHSIGSQCLLVNDHLMSGDTLFIGSCGRCDMPGSSPKDLFTSLNEVIAPLPDQTIVFPGHNYSRRGTSASLKEEKQNNRFLQSPTSKDLHDLMGV